VIQGCPPLDHGDAKDSPPYFHDGRLPTLEDTVEFFNLVLSLNLNQEEKTALVAFMRQL
jgi:cytochrome c peroxidase